MLDPSWNPLSHSADELLYLSLAIFRDTGLLSHFRLPLPRLRQFLVAVRLKYRPNPYHNWYHGFGVFYFAYKVLSLLVWRCASTCLGPLRLADDAVHPVGLLGMLATPDL